MTSPTRIPDSAPAQANASDDLIVRGTAAEGMIRALAIRGTGTVREAQRTHGLSPLATAALGRLIMASQIMGSLFKDSGDKLSLMVRADGSLGSMTAIAGSDGTVKGYVQAPDASCATATPTAADVAANMGPGTLAVVRTSPHMEPYVSQIALANGTISDDLTAYYIVSEQIPTIVSLDVTFDPEGTVADAGGYFIQLMPGYDATLLAQLETAVSAAQVLPGTDPQAMLEAILGEMGFKPYETTPTAFRCDCSRERSEQTLLSLGETELRALADDGEPVEIKCDYCSTCYVFTPEQVRALTN